MAEVTWINRQDRLPDAQTGALVLAWHDQGGMKIETAYRVGKLSHYTHWAELPVAPGASAAITADTRVERTGNGERAQGSAHSAMEHDAAAQGTAAQSAAAGSVPENLTPLYAAREAAGLTPAMIAKAAGIETYDYMRYEQGKCEPTVHNAIRIADALNTLDLRNLFNYTPVREKPEPSRYPIKSRATKLSGRDARLYIARKAAGLFQSELARYAGIDHRRYSSIETQVSKPMISTALRIADVLGITDIREIF